MGRAERPDGSIRGNCHIALFDILGFKQLVNSRRVADLLRILGPKSFWGQAPTMMPLIGQLPHVSGFKSAPLIAVRFSDTIMLCSPDKSERGLVSVLQGSLILMTSAILEGIPIRGAITKGELFISADRTAFFGESLVRAHELEQQQDWAGGIIDTERIAISQPTFLTTQSVRTLCTIPYDVPLKSGDNKQHLCLNWPPMYNMAAKRTLEHALRRHLPVVDASAQNKIRETIKFYDFATAEWSRRHPDGVLKAHVRRNNSRRRIHPAEDGR